MPFLAARVYVGVLWDPCDEALQGLKSAAAKMYRHGAPSFEELNQGFAFYCFIIILHFHRRKCR